MENRYKEICKLYHHKPKVFTKIKSSLSRQIGNPDLMILFTATASHEMARCAVLESARTRAILERSHTSSANALIQILKAYT